MRKLAVGLIALIAGAIAAVALAAGTPTTGTNTSCATATTPAHTVGVDGTDVHTIPGDTATQCHVETYTIPTNTETVTVTTPTDTTTTTTTTPPPPPPGTNCAGTAGNLNFASMDACGYPSPNTTGVPAVTTLTPEPDVNTSAAPYNCPANGPCLINAVSSSGLTVNTKNVTIQNSRFSDSGTGWAIGIKAGAANTIIRHTTFQGPSGTNNLFAAIYNQADNTLVMDYDLSINVERIWYGYFGGTLSNSYCDDTNVTNTGAHYECVYTNGTPMVIDHDTLVNGHSQSADINTDSGDTSNTIKNSLFVNAPGPYIIDLNPGTNTFTNNRIARQVYGGDNLWHSGSSGGKYTASGNVWDDTNTTADCSSGGCA